ncbi:MAG: FecR domain-containing protein, partial [Deltaproteobacteria bacterium]|nr:FecR domain-containing protein [Deltaproteobacteria bacterium]
MKSRLCLLVFLCFFLTLSFSAMAAEEEVVELKVAKDDSLINICKKYLEDPKQWTEVARVNRLKNPDRIYPGQILNIPVSLLKGTPLEARVTFIKGEVIFQDKETEGWTKLNLNDRVKQGSTIKTGDRSAVEITFEDGDSFFLRSNTTLGLTFAQRKGAFYKLRKLFLQKGRTVVRAIPSTGTKSSFEVGSRNAVAGVRGTEFRASVDPEDTTRMEVLKGAVGLEAMNQRVEVKEGEGSLVRKGEPPLKPRKLLPPPAPVDLEPLYRMMPLRFKFSGIEGANAYRVLLARERDFKDVVQEKLIRPSETLEMTGIEDGTYYLQSLSIDDLGMEGLPLRPMAIKVRVNPQPPFTEFPTDGAAYKKKTLTFKWLKVRDAWRYHIQIAEDQEFTIRIEDRKDIQQTEWLARDLNFQRYWFRISSIADDGYEGLWSDPLHFSVLPPPPAPPVEKPEVDQKEIIIRWRDLGKGIRYQFQMARDAGFKEIIVARELEKPEITLPKPEEIGTYYVRTKGIDPDGYAG